MQKNNNETSLDAPLMARRQGQGPRLDTVIDKDNTNSAWQDSDRHQSMPDRNIQLALNELHNPQRRAGETRDEYKAHLATSARHQQRKPVGNEKVPENWDQTRHERQAEK